MNDILLVLGLAGVFFGAMAFRGIFGYLKNQKIALGDLKFSWKEFIGGSIRPVLITVAVGALTALILGFLRLVGASGIQVEGLDQITPQTLEIGLVIADIMALGYAIKEALLCFGLSEKQIQQIRETASSLEDGEELGVALTFDGADLIAEASKVQQDLGGGEVTDGTQGEYGSFPYYKVDVSTPTAFYNAVNGKGFNEGFGYQCTAGFKEFMYSLAGKIVATLHGNAKDYAEQRSQIEPLGFAYHNDKKLQNGDWVILGGSGWGHVAMYYNGQLFGQNQGASNPNVGNAFNLKTISLDAYLCHYRPNIYKQTPTPTTDIKVGDKVTLTNWVDYNGKALAKTRDFYFVSELNGNRAVLRADSVSGAVYAAVNTSNLKKYTANSGSKPSTTSGAKQGDYVTTTATKDAQNGKYLNLRVINDGKSIWASTNGNGNAVLKTASGTVRCAVPVNTLKKV